MTPARSSSSSRLISIDRDIVGTPLAMAENVSAPNIKLRTISGFHRSARISDARATGQYWWYVPMGRSCHRRGATVVLNSNFTGWLSARTIAA